MRKTALLALCALVLGVALGLSLGGGGSGGLLAGAAAPAGERLAPSAQPALDTADNGPLLEAGNAVLEVLRAGDVSALSALVDPELGLTFTPYSTVDPSSDLTFLPEQLDQAAISGSAYIWGTTQGRGDPITMTLPEYLSAYVFDADYAQAPLIGVDHVLSSGNSLENVADAYPEARFLEYYFPGRSPEAGGLDWCALKLVFREAEGSYRLIGAIHSEWTI